jgi:hypothetical protein
MCPEVLSPLRDTAGAQLQLSRQHLVTMHLACCCRFAAPSRRTATIRFSESAVVHQQNSGYWCISMRLANIRKHTLVQPEVQVSTGYRCIQDSNAGRHHPALAPRCSWYRWHTAGTAGTSSKCLLRSIVILLLHHLPWHPAAWPPCAALKALVRCCTDAYGRA